MKKLKNNIFTAKYETIEFVTADSFLVGGGFLIGTNYLDSSISTPIGGIFVAIGLFLGLRVLWKFSKDLKFIKSKVDSSTKLLDKTGLDVKNNNRLLNNANNSLINTQKELEKTKRELLQTKLELQKTLKEIKESEKKIFGYSGSRFSRSSSFNPIEKSVDDLKKRLSKLEQERERARRGF